MVFPVVGGDGKPTGYEIDNSLRFNRADNPRLSRTPSSAGNRKTFTISTWIKFCNSTLGSASQNIFESRPASGSYFLIVLTATNNATGGNTIRINASSSIGGTTVNIGIDRFFRDPSAWYHLVLAFDTTQGTASNRIKMYVNGEQTGLNSTYTTYPDQNEEFYWNNNNIMVVGGSAFSSSEDSDIYLAETYNIDGQQLDSSYFGETNDNGVWIPKDASGDLTFGTNGFYLEYKQTGTSQNSSGIGADTSGNDNHFATTNLAATDVTTDTPTNNFATLNPLRLDRATAATYSEGNTKVSISSSHGRTFLSNIAVANGKWYAEFKHFHGSNTDAFVGVVPPDRDTSTSSNQDIGSRTGEVGWRDNGSIRQGSSIPNDTESSWTADDILGIALDMDNGKVYFHKNGTYQNSADPSGTNGYNLSLSEYCFALDSYADDGYFANFGNPAFSISSGNSDSEGHGNFEYAVPSGYFALCTKNLAEYG